MDATSLAFTAATRATAVPTYVSQLGVETDTLTLWRATGTVAGAWEQVPTGGGGGDAGIVRHCAFRLVENVASYASLSRTISVPFAAADLSDGDLIRVTGHVQVADTGNAFTDASLRINDGSNVVQLIDLMASADMQGGGQAILRKALSGAAAVCEGIEWHPSMGVGYRDFRPHSTLVWGSASHLQLTFTGNNFEEVAVDFLAHVTVEILTAGGAVHSVV